MLQLNFNPFPLLVTERLLLRKITLHDADEIFMLRSSKNIMLYIDRPMAIDKTDAINYINIITDALTNNAGITWGITLKNNKELIGTIGFWRILKEHYRAEIGYMLNESFQRKGIMQEAIAAVLGYGFDIMQLHSVEANVNPLNTASQKILERNGFVPEAHFRENYYYNGKFLDTYIYSLLTPNK